jgi:hypothetical protein
MPRVYEGPMPPTELARIRVSSERDLVLRVNDQAGTVDVRLWAAD